ncbi:MAG: DNA-directed RNA polymerase subunit omega [Deltaproteobacteria bacterium]|nr:MAG: DNA-directed RNA polymerase subunit omega [Deltaproteobacteria bacterium]RLB86912.1 MAG: DNA-directed RNA polymerase subunit omega [Deltaproteobacteria bacterium]
MARITVEDCLRNVENRFALIHLAAKRVRQLRKGAEPLVQAKNKDVVIALREIAAGKVYPVSKDELEQLKQSETDIEPESLPEPVKASDSDSDQEKEEE